MTNKSHEQSTKKSLYEIFLVIKDFVNNTTDQKHVKIVETKEEAEKYAMKKPKDWDNGIMAYDYKEYVEVQS